MYIYIHDIYVYVYIIYIIKFWKDTKQINKMVTLAGGRERNGTLNCHQIRA